MYNAAHLIVSRGCASPSLRGIFASLNNNLIIGVAPTVFVT